MLDLDLSSIVHRIINRVGAPVVHENGFIQLAIVPDGSVRLHVWPDTPIIKQATSSPIHDHRFTFVSHVLHGTLDHIVYQPRQSPSGPYVIAHVVRGRLVIPTEAFHTVQVVGHEIVRAGKSYTFPAKRFHESRGRGLTVTVMEKIKIHPHTVRVVCHREEPPDNDFSRTDQNAMPVLWGILDTVVRTGCLG